MCPSSWKARMRCSGIARPTWMSGEVTSMPSFTRSGRPSCELRLEPALGEDVDGVPRELGEGPFARRVYAATISGALVPRSASKHARAQAAAQDPQAPPARPPPRPRSCSGSTSFTFGLVTSRSRARSRSSTRRGCRRAQATATSTTATGERVLAVLRGTQSRDPRRRPRRSRTVMKQAIVAIEDKRFYEHRGDRRPRHLRARSGRTSGNKAVVEGGSTITQQFVKNAYTKNQRSIARKLKEAALAWQLEQRWSKDRILTAYLNTIYFGNGAYGVEQAARDLLPPRRRQEALARRRRRCSPGSPPIRALYDPVTNPSAARERRRHGAEGACSIRATSPTPSTRRATRATLPRPGGRAPRRARADRRRTSRTTSSSSSIDHYGSGRVFGGGLRVTTTIDLGLQQLRAAGDRASG